MISLENGQGMIAKSAHRGIEHIALHLGEAEQVFYFFKFFFTQHILNHPSVKFHTFGGDQMFCVISNQGVLGVDGS